MTAPDVLVAVAAGVVAGAMAGLLGLGGGILMVPAMAILLDQPQHVAAGTSLLVMIPTTIIGARENARRGMLDARAAVRLGLAGAAGAVVGALLALHLIDEEMLRRIFGTFLLAVSVRLLFGERRSE